MLSLQLTPKASTANHPNPFDLPSSFHHHLLATHSPSLSFSSHSSFPFLSPSESGALTPTPSACTPGAHSFAATTTTQLSIHAPVFNNMHIPDKRPKKSTQNIPTPSSPSSTSSIPTPSSSASSKGQIHVKLIQARGLNVPSLHSRPYVVVQFEQNEFVSRDNTDESDREVKGTPITLSRNPSSSALASLAALEISSRSPKTSSSPSSSLASAKTLQPPATTTASGAPLPLLGLSRLSPHNPVWKHQVSFDVTSENSLISFNVYDRSVEDQGFLGTFQVKPILIHDHTVDQWYKLRPYNQEVVSGEMRVQVTFEQYQTKRALSPRDFEFLKLIGRGTFGKVFQVRKKDTRRIYAMKVLSKKEIVAKKEVAHTIGERKILQRSLESPFLVGLKFSFQTELDLYLVTDFKSGGELFWHLQRETRFTEERARFYIAELVLALEHLHKYNIVYRDLKPENILLDATGHVALCDFGLSKADLRTDELTTTFCGTTEYLAPEILLDEQGYSKIVDFWSLGVLLFEMCCGWSPFYAEDTQQMYKNICFGKIRFPKGVINEDGKQFVKGLLNRNPKHRLGAQRDAAELKEHPFFSSIDWKALALKQVTPPFKPVVESDESTDNFDPEFTNADVRAMGYHSDSDDENLDDEDPSEDWVSQSLSTSFMGGLMHQPNGPLGSENKSNKSSPITTPGLNGHGPISSRNNNAAATAAPTKKGIDIKQKKKKKDAAGSPLTNSVQANFEGFTFSGRESVHTPAGIIGGRNRNKESDSEAVSDAEVPEVTTEDEYEDYKKSAGRYANARRKGLGMTSMEDDMPI